MNTVTIEEFLAVERNTLRGFCRVRLPSGLIIHDVAIHQKNGSAWASPPSKAMLTRDGQQMKNNEGKPLWLPTVTFASRETRDKFSDAVPTALRLVHPEVLADARAEATA
jgi:hypothetical protein